MNEYVMNVVCMCVWQARLSKEQRWGSALLSRHQSLEEEFERAKAAVEVSRGLLRSDICQLPSESHLLHWLLIRFNTKDHIGFSMNLISSVHCPWQLCWGFWTYLEYTVEYTDSPIYKILLFTSPKMSDQDYTDLYLCKDCHQKSFHFPLLKEEMSMHTLKR